MKIIWNGFQDSLKVEENQEVRKILKNLTNMVLLQEDEVRENNERAIHLYEKYGFKEIYRRNKYYGDEDAIIMERMK